MDTTNEMESVSTVEPTLSADRSRPTFQSGGEVKKKRSVVGILWLITLISVASAIYYYRQFADLKQNPQKVAQEEVGQIVAKISQLLVLPEGEQPTLATVADPSKLKGQPFFTNAKVGDKVLFYTNAKKAILYDPVVNKIVEVAPINLGAQ